MLESTSTITVEQSIEKCFEYITEPVHATEWYSNVVKAERNKDETVAVGTHASLLTDIMGKKYDFDYVITEYEPLERMKMKADGGTFPMESEYLLEKIETGRTRITVINRADPKGIPFFLIGMVRKKVQETMDRDVIVLKEILEKL